MAEITNMDILGVGLPVLAGLLTSQASGSYFKDQTPTAGYQGGIPEYTAIRDVVPGTYDPNRRPGSGGQRYFTDTQFIPEGGDLAAARALSTQQASGLAALNAANPAQQAKPDPNWYLSAEARSYLDNILNNQDWTDEEKAQQVMAAMNQYNVSPFMLSETMGIPVTRIYDAMNKYGEANYSPVRMGENLPSYSELREQYTPTSSPQPDSGGNLQDLLDWLSGQSGGGTGGTGTGTGTGDPSIGEGQQSTSGQEYFDTAYATLSASGMPDQELGSFFDTLQAAGIENPPRWVWDNIMTGISTQDAALLSGMESSYPELFAIIRDLTGETRSFDEIYGGYAAGGYIGGTTDGMADRVPATIGKDQQARLSHGEFVIPADVVSHLGNGNSDSGAQVLYSMMDRIRTARTGSPQQGRPINPNSMTPV